MNYQLVSLFLLNCQLPVFLEILVPSAIFSLNKYNLLGIGVLGSTFGHQPMLLGLVGGSLVRGATKWRWCIVRNARDRSQTVRLHVLSAALLTGPMWPQ